MRHGSWTFNLSVRFEDLMLCGESRWGSVARVPAAFSNQCLRLGLDRSLPPTHSAQGWSRADAWRECGSRPMRWSVTTSPRSDSPPAGGRTFMQKLLVDVVGYYAPTKVGATLLGLLAMSVFTRLLDRTEYGAYALIWSSVALLNTFGFGWLHAAIVRFWGTQSASPEGRDKFLSVLLVGLGFSFGLLTLVAPFLAPVLYPGLQPSAPWLGLAFLASTVVIHQIIARSRARRELGLYALTSLLPRSVGILVGVLALTYISADGYVLALSMTVGFAVIGFAILVRRPFSFLPRKFCFAKDQAAAVAHYAVPVALASVGGVLLNLSDRFLVAQFFDVGAAGLYVVAYELALKVDVAAQFVISAAFPLLIQEYERRAPEEIGRQLSALVTQFSAFIVPAAVGFVLVADPLCALLLGPDFQDAPRYVTWLAPAGLALALTRYLSKPFQLVKQTMPSVVTISIAALLNLVANWILLPRHGPIAAAWTTTGATAVYLLMTYFWSRRLLPYRLQWGQLARVGISSLVMATAIALCPSLSNSVLELGKRILLGLLVYGAAGWLLGVPLVRAVIARLVRSQSRNRQGK